MARPEVQQQVAEMQAYMASPVLQQRMATLRDDPEFAEVFAEIQAGDWRCVLSFGACAVFARREEGGPG